MSTELIINMNFLVYFLLALLIGALVIGGWYNVTRGRWEIMPNEEKKWVGKIFCGWQKYWEQKTGEKKVYYSGLELKKLMFEIEQRFKLQLVESIPTTKEAKATAWYVFDRQFANPQSIILSDEAFVRLKNRFDLLMGNDIQYMIENTHHGFYAVSFYKKIPMYYFPEWLRDPIASCIYCFSSVYGIICWTLIGYVSNLCGIKYPIEAMIIACPAYCFALSVVTPLIQKKS